MSVQALFLQSSIWVFFFLYFCIYFLVETSFLKLDSSERNYFVTET
jgi:hypothetical protein